MYTHTKILIAFALFVSQTKQNKSFPKKRLNSNEKRFFNGKFVKIARAHFNL